MAMAHTKIPPSNQKSSRGLLLDYIPLEKPIAELEMQIEELHQMAANQALDLDEDIKRLEEEARKLRIQLFADLTPYEQVQLSRHPHRPHTLEMIEFLLDSFIELHGDRNFDDDKAIVGGVGYFNGQGLVVIGHQKGRGIKENVLRNFGMPRPEGYRKALRLMSMAERLRLPILTLIDTPGAYPGVGAEERGQAEAIGKNILVMAKLKVPIFSVVLGEGGSGGALALGVANRVYMLQYATYSVITPEGCASILMKDAKKAADAARSLQLTANAALGFGVIDGIIEEPLGGAHRDPKTTARNIHATLVKAWAELAPLSGAELVNQRMDKYLHMGSFDIRKPAK